MNNLNNNDILEETNILNFGNLGISTGNNNKLLNKEVISDDIIEYYNLNIADELIKKKISEYIINSSNTSIRLNKLVNTNKLVNIQDDIISDLILIIEDLEKVNDIIINISYNYDKSKQSKLELIIKKINIIQKLLEGLNIRQIIKEINDLKETIIDYLIYYYKIDEIEILAKKKNSYLLNLNKLNLFDILDKFINSIIDIIKSNIIDFSFKKIVDKNKSQKNINNNIKKEIRDPIINAEDKTIINMYMEYKKNNKFNILEKKKYRLVEFFYKKKVNNFINNKLESIDTLILLKKNIEFTEKSVLEKEYIEIENSLEKNNRIEYNNINKINFNSNGVVNPTIDLIPNNNDNNWQQIIRSSNLDNELVHFITYELNLYTKYFNYKNFIVDAEKINFYEELINIYIKSKNDLIDFLFEINLAINGDRNYLNQYIIRDLLYILAKTNLELKEDFFLLNNENKYVKWYDNAGYKYKNNKIIQKIIKFIKWHENKDLIPEDNENINKIISALRNKKIKKKTKNTKITGRIENKKKEFTNNNIIKKRRIADKARFKFIDEITKYLINLINQTSLKSKNNYNKMIKNPRIDNLKKEIEIVKMYNSYSIMVYFKEYKNKKIKKSILVDKIVDLVNNFLNYQYNFSNDRNNHDNEYFQEVINSKKKFPNKRAMRRSSYFKLMNSSHVYEEREIHNILQNIQSEYPNYGNIIIVLNNIPKEIIYNIIKLNIDIYIKIYDKLFEKKPWYRKLF